MKPIGFLHVIVMLFIFSAPTQAATFELGTLPPGNTAISNFSPESSVSNDIWKFSLEQTSIVYSIVLEDGGPFGEANAIILPESSGFIRDSSGNEYYTHVGFDSVPLSAVVSGPFVLYEPNPTKYILGPGDYELHLSVIYDQNYASYAGTINVAPVPEPSTWLLMFCGLGLTMFLRKRRS